MIRGTIALALTLAAGSAQAGGPAPFTEEALARGVTVPIEVGFSNFGNGPGMFDIDGDGDPDIVTSNQFSGLVRFFENDGTGNFTDRTYQSNGFTPRVPLMPNYTSVAAADYDADGDLDFYFGGFSVTGENRLYRNDGDWNFTDVTAQAGVECGGATQGVNWGDFNADGWLDLYVSNRSESFSNFTQNRLFMNMGDGTFVDVAPAAGVDYSGPVGFSRTFVATFFDMDGDADPDLYLGQDKASFGSESNYLMEKTSSFGYKDITLTSGTYMEVDCMGIGVGDLDRNGYLDLYGTHLVGFLGGGGGPIGPGGAALGNVLCLNNGDKSFFDGTEAAGIGDDQVGWATAFFDYDNDGDEDVYVCNIFGPNRMFVQPDVWPFEELGAELGVDDAQDTYTMALGDVDMDGDLDMLVATLGRPLRLYINNEGQNRNFMKFKVVGQGANLDGVGTQVYLKAPSMPQQLRELFYGNNFKSMNETLLHFGLGDDTLAKIITVRWPNTADTRVLNNYAANNTWTLYPPEKLGDANQDGLADFRDLMGALAHLTARTGSFAPGDELFDMDGDADVDIQDLIAIGLKISNAIAPVGDTSVWRP